MLLVAAALLFASMHSSGVVEASVTPVVQAVAQTAVTTDHTTPVATGIRARSASAAVTPSVRRPVMTGGHDEVVGLLSARGSAFLDELARLTPAQLREAARDARVLAAAEDDPPGAEDVRRWWAALPESRRAALLVDAPVIVGNLEGVPYVSRDAANRQVLRAGLGSDADDPQVDVSRRAMLGQVRDALVVQPGDPRKWLLTLDARGAGRAAIAVGDLDSASHVTVVVPGMFFTVTGQMVDFTSTANDLYGEQATLTPLSATGRGEGVAVVAWMGYRTPDLSNILSLDLARTGAARLERALGGVRVLRAGDEPTVSVVAHSYGSTTALMALSTGTVHVDSLTLLGSPGSSVRSASQLAVTAGQVFVGGAHGDPVAGSGYFGTDPGSSGFGSTAFDLAGGLVADGDVYRRPFGHNDYLKQGTASQHDVALVAIGRGDLVREEARRRQDERGGGPQGSPDFLLVRPQDLQQRD